VLAGAALRRASSPGSQRFAMAMLAASLWLAGSAMEVVSMDVSQKVFWAKITYVGSVWMAPLWLLFAMDFVSSRLMREGRLPLTLMLIPAVTLGLVFTNEQHRLIWQAVFPAGGSSAERLVYQHGLWYWIFITYSYALVLIAGILLLYGALQFHRAYRRIPLGLLIGTVILWLGNLIYVMEVLPPMGLYFAPYVFVLSGLLFAWLMFHEGMFDISPLAYEAVLEHIHDGCLVVDMRGRILEANGAVRRQLALGDGEIRLDGEAALGAWPALVSLLRGDENGPLELATGGDPPQILEVNASDWFDKRGRPSGRLLIFHDISRRKQVEASLRASEQLYRLVVEAAPVGIVITDVEGMVTFASPNLKSMYRAEETQQVVGTMPVQWIHPEDRPAVLEGIYQVLSQQTSIGPYEYRLLRKDGTSFWGEITSVPVINGRGAPREILSIIHDTTQRKHLELSLQASLERQTFINGLLQMLHCPEDLHHALLNVLSRTGNYFQASRICLYREKEPQGLEYVSGWTAPGYVCDTCPGKKVSDPFPQAVQQTIQARGYLTAPDAAAAPSDLRAYMETLSAFSLGIFPVYGDHHAFGFLQIEHCAQPFEWRTDDTNQMAVVCSIISSTLAQIRTEAVEQRQRVLAEILHDTASAMNRAIRMDEAFDRILVNLDRLVPNMAANIAMLDEEGLLRFVRWNGYAAEADAYFGGLRLTVSGLETYRSMMETGEPVIMGDTWADRRWKVYEPLDWIRSYAAMPIRIKGKVEGFINIDSQEPDFFTPDLSYTLHVFADQAAVAIENARLYEAANRRVEEMSLLYRVGLTLTAGLEIEQVLLSLFEECRQALPIDVFYVALFDAETGRIDFPLFYNETAFEVVSPLDIQNMPGLTGEVIRGRRTIAIPDLSEPGVAEQFSILHMGGREVRSYVGVPLILLDRVEGVISMQNFSAHTYSPEQVRLLETIATQAAVAVQNARLYDQMKQMAITDSVTGLFTRRHFTALGRSEVERALRYDRHLSVLMVDIDRFKRVNDTYGHNAGDHVLQMVARMSLNALRATDIVARWGGEEFVIVLPEADLDGATLIGERIRRMVSECVTGFGEHAIRVTVSIGVATMNDHCCSLEVLIDRADRALYLAKEGGRNQVCCG
jgi:diguanylate cyclase (GGDEF)-like protein/PAS domain S-box-containing protein